jgi:hypothetical protein
MIQKFEGVQKSTLLYNQIIERNYSYSEKDDYYINVKPYRDGGFIIEPQGKHQYGHFILTGWRCLYTGSNRS